MSLLQRETVAEGNKYVEKNIADNDFEVGTIGLEPMTSAMWLQRSKPAGLRPYFKNDAKVMLFFELPKHF